MKKIKISEIYYILTALGYVTTLVFTGMRPGVFGAFLMVLVLAQLVAGKQIKPCGMCDMLAIAFFAYQILSVIWLTLGGYPLSVFINEFVSSSFPIIFYFVGRSEDTRVRIWYRNYLYAMLLLGILGVVLYITAPQFYCDWAYRWSYISKADAPTMRVRMHSVVGSTCLSFITVAGMLAGSYFLGSGAKENDREGTADEKKDIIFAVATITACFLFAVMANQRSGLVAAALVLVYINYLLFFKLDLINRKYFVFELIAIAAVFALICAVRFEFILKFWYRIISLPTAISQRSEQWVAAVNNMYSSWIGNGLGANGHRAIGIEDAHVIADGGLVKLYCENGVIGISIFIFLLIQVLSNGIKNIRSHYVEAGIITVALLQSIGSNMLAFQLCTPIFWFAVGRCAGTGRYDHLNR
ncbi:MAG: hypothetical protein K6F28_04800 [Lachnospiraceae bacterium]|nr:hypothetical protein [Lachnospiraceae bacterium]